MNINDICNNFVLPGEKTAEALRAMNLKENQLEAGVSRFQGHDNGVAFRFFVLAEYNERDSKAKKQEVYDEPECIEWMIDKFNKPTERLSMLPPELLQIDEYGDVTGKLAEAYVRFKKGLGATGTPLNRWVDKNNKIMLSLGEIAALEKHSIFTVEQLAAQRRDKISDKFGPAIMEKFERAIQFVNGAAQMAEASVINERLALLEKQNAELLAKLAEREDPAPVKKTWSRQKKVPVVEDGVIKE